MLEADVVAKLRASGLWRVAKKYFSPLETDTQVQYLCKTFIICSVCANWKGTICCILIGQILALVAVRKAMDYVFSQHDLSFLDDVIPEKDKKKKEDEKKKKKKKQGSIDSDMEDVSFLKNATSFCFYITIMNTLDFEKQF